jgi:hypothetical protein
MSSRFGRHPSHFVQGYLSSQFQLSNQNYLRFSDLLLKGAKCHMVDLRMVRQSIFVEFTNLGIFEITSTTI